jgi:hypothetical protein
MMLRTLAGLVAAWFVSSAPVFAFPHADRVIVHKKEHTMELMCNGKVLKTYKVALGRRSGPKEREGDLRTPEGKYVIDRRNRPTPTRRTGRVPADSEFPRAATSLSMVCQTAMATLAPRTVSMTGPMAVSRLRMGKSKKSGSWWRMARRLRSCLRILPVVS